MIVFLLHRMSLLMCNGTDLKSEHVRIDGES
jgi:hypothetical protein